MSNRISIKDALKKNQEKVIFGGLVLLVIGGVYFYFNEGEVNSDNNEFTTSSQSEVDRYNQKTTKVNSLYQREKTPEVSQGLESIYATDPYEEEVKPIDTIPDANIVNVDLDKINQENEEKRIAQLLEESKRREELLKEQLRNSSAGSGGGSNVANVNTPVTKAKPKKDYKAVFNKKQINSESATALNNSEVYSGAISGEQKLKTGQNITLVTNEIFTTANGIKIPKYTYIVGKVIFSEYRADIVVTSVKIGNKIHSVNIEVYGSDGAKGVPINVDRIMQKGKTDAIDDALSSDVRTSTAGRIVSDVISSKSKEQEVTFVNNQIIYFKVK